MECQISRTSGSTGRGKQSGTTRRVLFLVSMEGRREGYVGHDFKRGNGVLNKSVEHRNLQKKESYLYGAKVTVSGLLITVAT